MIILNKKRILFIILLIIFFIICYSLKYKNLNSIEVSSTPVSNHTVILDAGHGLPDEGC